MKKGIDMNHLKRMIVAAVLICCSFGAKGFTVPSHNGRRVSDYANLLTGQESASIETSLKSYEQETSNQIAILTTDDLQGETIESYANQVFRSWKLGQKDKNNGVLMVIAVGPKNTARIEVGYGLEGALPDITASHIISDDMRPAFKQKQYYACITSGIAAIKRAISGEYTVAAPVSGAGDGADGVLHAKWILVGIILFVLFIVAGLAGIAHPIWGGMVGGVGTFFTVYLIIGTWFLAVVLAVLGFLIGLVAKHILEGVTSGSSGGGSSSDSSWSSSSSSDSFSGGGGSSGGGGASGSLD